MLGDGLSERLTLLGVVGRVVETALGQAHGARTDGGPHLVEADHRGLEALVQLTHLVLERDGHVVEVEHAGRDAAHAHLALVLGDAEARRVSGHDVVGDAARAGVGVGLGGDGDEVRLVGPGAEALGAVDDPLVALLDGARRMLPRLSPRGVR